MKKLCNKKRWLRGYFVIGTVLVAFLSIALHGHVFATSSTNYNSVPVKKALLTGVYRCYSSGAISSSVPKLSEFDSFGQLVIKYTGHEYHQYVALPSGLTNIKDNNIACKELFVGGDETFGGNFEGVLGLAGKNGGRISDKEQKIALLNGMGYTQISDSSSSNCISFSYVEKSPAGTNSNVQTDGVCAEVNPQGIITKLSIDRSAGTYYGHDYTGQYSPISPFFGIVNNKVSLLRAGSAVTTLGVNDKWSDFQEDLRKVVSSAGRNSNGSFTYSYRGGSGPATNIEYTLNNGSLNDDSTGDASYAFVRGSAREAANMAIDYLSNGSLAGYNSLGFSNEEKLSLLMMSLKEYFYAGKSNASEYWVCDVSDWADYGGFPESYAINVSSSGKVGAKCRLNPSMTNADNRSGTIYGFKNSYFDSAGSTKLDLEATIKEINKLANQLPKDTIVDANETEGEGGGGSSDAIAPCYEAAGALGWIICPVLSTIGNVVDGIYQWIESTYLVINPSFLSRNSGTYQGWSIFRNLANIIFAIMFVVVILAQVTGIGISNYNIKKILPRLIMVVVLVNISFILCQLAVDVSNILGYYLNEMFLNFSSDPKFSVGAMMPDFIQSMLGTAEIAVVGVAISAAILRWWLLPFLLVALTTVISILFFFVVLGVRQAGVIVLVVLAPVAIVCYVLPNTKTFFDRWKKIFSSLLVVYPICGVLMGGGQFVSTLMLSNLSSADGDFVLALIAMLIQVVPFFFIPSLVKGSLAAIGNLGTKISTMGKSFGGRITSGISGTERFKDAQRRFDMRDARLTAEKLDKKAAKLAASGGALSAGQMRRRRNAVMRYNRARFEDMRAGDGQELMLPGSLLSDSTQERISSERLQEDAKAQRVFYESDKSELNTNDSAAVGDEYGRELDNLYANPTDRNTLVKVRALQDMLSGTDKGRAQVQSQMLRVARMHSTDPGFSQNTAISTAARHLMNSYGNDYKKANRGAFAMINDFTNRDFSKVGSIAETTQLDANGNRVGTGNFRSSYYDQQGVNSYTPETLVNADDSALDGLRATLPSMDARSRSKILATASRALGNDNIAKKPEVEERLRNMIIDGNDETTIGGTGANALHRMATAIEENTMDASQREKLADQAQGALTGNHVTNIENAAALNHILEAAGRPAVPLEGRFNTQGSNGTETTIPIPRNTPPTQPPANPSTPPEPAPVVRQTNTPPSTPASQNPTVRQSNMPTLDTPPSFITNPDGTVSGGAGPFQVSGATVTQSGIILPNERPTNRQPRPQPQPQLQPQPQPQPQPNGRRRRNNPRGNTGGGTGQSGTY